MALLTLSPAGLYCAIGDFYIDPWKPVRHAIVTHAHADHLRWGSEQYLVSAEGLGVTRCRLGANATIDTLRYGEVLHHQGVQISLHPAGHIRGSAQIRLEHQGETWVVSGDYKTDSSDPTCTPFEPVRCHGFVTESTFGLPVYRWPNSEEIRQQIHAWWRTNAEQGLCSVIFTYALGKAQRILSMFQEPVGPIYTHGAVEKLTQTYRDDGVSLPATQLASFPDFGKKNRHNFAGAMVIAPPSAQGSPWLKKFEPLSTAMASGWMTIRGPRRRRSVDRGFVVSDHADWPGLQSAIRATGAEHVWVTHGYTAVLVRCLLDQGLSAQVLETRFEGEAGGDLPAEETSP